MNTWNLLICVLLLISFERLPPSSCVDFAFYVTPVQTISIKHIALYSRCWHIFKEEIKLPSKSWCRIFLFFAVCDVFNLKVNNNLINLGFVFDCFLFRFWFRLVFLHFPLPSNNLNSFSCCLCSCFPVNEPVLLGFYSHVLFCVFFVAWTHLSPWLLSASLAHVSSIVSCCKPIFI